MKKTILNLGKPLNQNEQQKINGGRFDCIAYIDGAYICIQFGRICNQQKCWV